MRERSNRMEYVMLVFVALIWMDVSTIESEIVDIRKRLTKR